MVEHSQGLIEGYTSRRRPVMLVWAQHFFSIEDATRAERQIKGWSRKKKEALIHRNFDLLKELSKNRTGVDTRKFRRASTSSA
jgi:predicted GIY-YIG superfamily endonuclease